MDRGLFLAVFRKLGRKHVYFTELSARVEYGNWEAVCRYQAADLQNARQAGGDVVGALLGVVVGEASSTNVYNISFVPICCSVF